MKLKGIKGEFWCENPYAAAALCKELFPAEAERAIMQAEAVLKNSFLFSDHWEMERTQEAVTFEEKINWAHIPGDDPEWLYAMNRHTSFLNLGKAWLYTGEQKYADKLAELMEDWITGTKLTEESKNSTWRSLEAGLRCENWLRSLGMTDGSTAFSAELLGVVEHCIREHGEYLRDASDAFHRLSNWGVLQDHGLFLAGIFLSETEWITLALKRLDREVQMQIMTDGSQWEQSPMYHCEVLHCVLDTLLIAGGHQIAVPKRLRENAHRMCLALAAWVKPNGRLFGQSDSDDTDARDILAQGAILFSDGTLKAAAGEMLYEENVWDFGAEVLKRYKTIDAEWKEIESTALPDSGNYILRGEKGPDAAYLHMHCGCLGSGHGHADLLHIDAGIYGEDVLLDSGRYTYVNTELRRQLKEPAAHNTLRVDRQDFSVCLDSWGYEKLAAPIKGEYRFHTYADYISGMHLGYFDLADSVLTERRVIFLKPDIFLIFDRIYAHGIHTCEQDFHFNQGILKQEEPGEFIWTGKSASARLTAVTGGREVSQGRYPYSKDYNLLEEGDKLTFSKSGEGVQCMVTALVTGKAGSLPKAGIREVPVSMVRSGKVLGENQAKALEIEKEGKLYTVIVVYDDIISEVDYFRAGTREAYGKVMVFVPEEEDGICLAW